MPSARYSLETTSAYSRTLSGSNSAAIPRPSGHLDTSAAAVANSAPEASAAPWRGSEEMLTGTPRGWDSARACRALFQRAAVAASWRVMTRTWRTKSSPIMARCWSVSVQAGTSACANVLP